VAGASGRRTSGVDRRGETSWRPVSNVPCAIVVDPYRSTAERRYAIRVSPTALRPDPSPGLRPGLLWDHAFGVEVLPHQRCISIKAQGSALGYRTRLNRSLKGCSMDPEFLDEPEKKRGPTDPAFSNSTLSNSTLSNSTRIDDQVSSFLLMIALSSSRSSCSSSEAPEPSLDAGAGSAVGSPMKESGII